MDYQDTAVATSDIIPQTSDIKKVKPIKSDKKWQKLSIMPRGIDLKEPYKLCEK